MGIGIGEVVIIWLIIDLEQLDPIDLYSKTMSTPFIRMGKVIRFDEKEVYEYLKKYNG